MEANGDNALPDCQLRRRGSRARDSEVVSEVSLPETEGTERVSEPNNPEVIQPLYKRIWNYQPDPNSGWMRVAEQTGIPGVVEIAKPDRHITVR